MCIKSTITGESIDLLEITSCGSEGCCSLTALDFGVLKTESPFWADFASFAESEGVASTFCSSCWLFWLESARICDNSGSSVERSIDGTGPAALVWTCGPAKLLSSITISPNNYLSSKSTEIVTQKWRIYHYNQAASPSWHTIQKNKSTVNQSELCALYYCTRFLMRDEWGSCINGTVSM